MTLNDLLHLINQHGMIAQQSWAAAADERGQRIARFRRYVEGDFDADMTPEMRNLLRLNTPTPPANLIYEAGINYCETVVSTMSDRLRVRDINADSDDMTAWIARLLRHNRFDGLQIDVHDACLRDGDTYVMVEWDAVQGMPRLVPQMAWDGNEGLLVVYARSDKRDIAVALKVWRETRHYYADTLRVNVYRPDGIERYAGAHSGNLQRIERADWTTRTGEPLGVPVVAFSNKARGTSPYGISELESITYLQDMLNRAAYSLTATAELTAFPIYIAKGFTPPAALTPGMILTIGAEGIGAGQVADFSKIEGSDARQYIEQARFLIEQIYHTSKTPLPTAGDDVSGESLKQREIALLGKIARFHIKIGAAWQDVVALAHRVQGAFGPPPPRYDALTVDWLPGAVRD